MKSRDSGISILEICKLPFDVAVFGDRRCWKDYTVRERRGAPNPEQGFELFY